jgi:ADP-ribosylglycohydrolase
MSAVQAAILGLCVGDALGVPVEFRSREALQLNPVTVMLGYGSHSQPIGTWSDDSSLTFCLMESLIECKDINLFDIAGKFTEWLWRGYWTPHGKVFDVGAATARAIERVNDEFIRPDLAGGKDEYSNGNGSLMRILPLAFYLFDKPLDARVRTVTEVSSITHGHRTSIISCMIYVEVAICLLQGISLPEALLRVGKTMGQLNFPSRDLIRFNRIFSRDFSSLSIEEIHSSGYVVHTLEASIWSLLTSESYDEAVLKAVNLGEDTDTTGAVTGGLAGIQYGVGQIPADWIEQLARLDDVMELCSKFERQFYCP